MRHMRWWQTQHDMFGPSGCLTIGYSYPNMYMAENYNSPGSPYWSMLAFICLAVPAEHPFWSASEEPYPSSQLPLVKPLKHPGHITVRMGGHSYLLSSGQACSYPMKGSFAKYCKMAYSSAYTYSVPPGSYTLEQYALDSTLGLSDDGGFMWKTRGDSTSQLEEHENSHFALSSSWRPFSDVQIQTWLIPSIDKTPNWHVRVHRIKTGRDLLTADGSFAICSTRQTTGRHLGPYDKDVFEGTSPIIIGNYDQDVPEGKAPGGGGAFALSKGAVGIAALESDTDRVAVIVLAEPNSNLVEPRTVIPTLRGKIGKGETKWYVSAIYAKPSGKTVDPSTYLEGWQQRPTLPGWINNMMNA